MLTLFSLLTGGGLIGSIVLLVLKPALRSAVGGVLGRIPPRVWGAVAVMALIFGLAWYHGHAVNAARSAGRSAGIAETNAAWDKAQAEWQRAAGQWARNVEARDRAIAEEERHRHDQTVRANRAVADALRLHGPGRSAALCVRPPADPGLPAAAGGPAGAPAGADAAGPGLPAGDRDGPGRERQWAIVPWSWLVERANDLDDLRSKVDAYNRWYLRSQAEWEKARADGPLGPPPAFGGVTPPDPVAAGPAPRAAP